MFKFTRIACVLVLMIPFALYDDPGIPPGGDPDIDEVPIDDSLWILIAAGGFYGSFWCVKYKKKIFNDRI